MQAGKLDRKITIQERTLTKNSYGEETESWSTFAEVWAEKRDAKGREFFSSSQVTSEIDTTFRIRWFSGINTQMRISYDGELYDIYSIAELGRREGMEIMAKAQGV